MAVPQIVVDTYSSDVDIKKLERQIAMLPDLVNTYTAEQNLKTLTVTNVRTIAEMLLNIPSAKAMFTEIDKLVRVFFTILITTATGERSFSVLCRIKTYLRSSMMEERPNNVILLHSHKDLTSNLESWPIVLDANSRSHSFFGSFA